MKTRTLNLRDVMLPPPEEYFVVHLVPDTLRERLLTYLYTERPELPKLVEAHDTATVYLDVHGAVYAANQKVRIRLPRGYTVECHLCHAHAVCAQLREGAYTTVTPKRGLPFVIVNGMYHAGVLYLDDVPRVIAALAERAVEGATTYTATRETLIAGGHVVDGRDGRLEAPTPADPLPMTYPPGTRVQVISENRPPVYTGVVLDDGAWDPVLGCQVQHDDGAQYGWGWRELRPAPPLGVA